MAAWDTQDTSTPVDSLRAELRRVALAHMLDAVERSWLDELPFPHFLVEGLFPDDLYRAMLAALPDPALYTPVSYEKHAERGVSNRGKFGLTDECIAQLTRRQRSLWLAVRDALGSVEFKRAVFRRLARGLVYRLGGTEDEAARTPGYALPELFRETEGYRIKPHPDTRRKLVTMQIALPADNNQPHLGTEFYRRSLSPFALLREPRGFEIVKQPPFIPNTAYAFVVLNTLRHKSWHGRTKLPGSAGVRNTILNIWYARPEDGNPDLVAQSDRRVVARCLDPRQAD